VNYTNHVGWIKFDLVAKLFACRCDKKVIFRGLPGCVTLVHDVLLYSMIEFTLGLCLMLILEQLLMQFAVLVSCHCRLLCTYCYIVSANKNDGDKTR